MLHKVLLAKPTLIPDDCSDSRWKWFKGCLGALDGTFVDVRVLEHEKGRYRTRKREVQQIVEFSGMQLIDRMDCEYRKVQWTRTTSPPHVNTLDDEGSSQQKRRGQNKDRTGPRRTWTMVEEEALVNGLKALVTTGWKCDNAFRNGYLAQLEAHIKRAFPQC
ncbi:UNVERIFIED_CONTAM: hypothetical protein Slati_3064600 [Sesamum latifolium]|uniref:Uncharacterized protein n=1 Tax=Sesamum latifolium TaxID=2727402 RepID=A0AAW2UTY1_9LAMI